MITSTSAPGWGVRPFWTPAWVWGIFGGAPQTRVYFELDVPGEPDDLIAEALEHCVFPLAAVEDVQRDGPTVYVRGEGVRITDINGREYLDMMSSHTRANSLGYGNAEIADLAAAGVIGVGTGLELVAGVMVAAALGIVVVSALWWLYFDVAAILARSRLMQASGVEQARLALHSYSYLHLPMIAGIVLFAKTPQAASNLFANWNTPKIQKIYRALAQNSAKRDTYEIFIPIGLVPHPLIGSVWAANPSGKPSKSLAKVISRTTSTTTFEVSLNSGRPHQIRIHLASIGHPLVGDPLYGLTGQPLENLPGLPGDGGYFLHAQFLKFHHPITGEQIHLEAALPSGFSLHQ